MRNGDIPQIQRAGHDVAGVDIGYHHALVVTERRLRCSRPIVTRCQNAAESGWKFFHARSPSEVWSAASIWTLAASDAINSIAAPESAHTTILASTL
jgi:hypothetical protein